jgi:hypothetical protein
VDVETVPSSRLTSFKVGSLPEKNSPAVKQGSEDGTGGYISDWKESDFRGTMNAIGSIAEADTL